MLIEFRVEAYKWGSGALWLFCRLIWMTRVEKTTVHRTHPEPPNPLCHIAVSPGSSEVPDPVWRFFTIVQGPHNMGQFKFDISTPPSAQSGPCNLLYTCHLLSAMGRPSGSMEKRLDTLEIEQVVEAISEEKMKSLILCKGSEDIRKLFGRSADENVTITRSYLEEHAWLLRPFLICSPVHIPHVDSTLSLCSPFD